MSMISFPTRSPGEATRAMQTLLVPEMMMSSGEACNEAVKEPGGGRRKMVPCHSMALATPIPALPEMEALATKGGPWLL